MPELRADQRDPGANMPPHADLTGALAGLLGMGGEQPSDFGRIVNWLVGAQNPPYGRTEAASTNWWEQARRIVELLRKERPGIIPNRYGVRAGSAPDYPQGGNPNAAQPTIAENDPFRKIVAAKLGAQGGEHRKMPSTPGTAPAEDVLLDPHFGTRYPHQDEPGSFKYITVPETSLQKELWREHFPPNSEVYRDYPKWHYDPRVELDKRVIGRAIGMKSPDAALGDAHMVQSNPSGPVRPGAPWAAGQEINKDLLWGPAPSFQGEQWRTTQQQWLDLIKRAKQSGTEPPLFPGIGD